MENLIPVTLLSGRTDFMPLAHIEANPGHYDIHRNRRGRIRHAAVKARRSLSPLTHDGESFIQKLESGIVWALKGTRGSRSDAPNRVAI